MLDQMVNWKDHLPAKKKTNLLLYLLQTYHTDYLFDIVEVLYYFQFIKIYSLDHHILYIVVSKSKLVISFTLLFKSY